MGRASRHKRERRLAASAVDAIDEQPPGSDRWVYVAVSACFLLSGFAALLYQTAWLRQFSIVFGTSELAVATVLAAYMAGLGAGAAIAARVVDRLQRPLLVYGILEGGIAVTALCVPALLAFAGWLHVLALGGLPEPPDAGGIAQPAYYLFVSFVILALPTGFMGATLPLLTRYAVHEDQQVGPRVAWLYGINTAGAVFGTLVAAFVLLPRVGLRMTVLAGVAVNILVFLIAAAIARRVSTAGRDTRSPDARYTIAPGARAERKSRWILPLILASGANAFLYEVLWTRLLNHALGGTIYAFATMLASFLSGIALGGMLAGKVASDRRRAGQVFAVCQVAIGVLSAGVYAWLEGYVPASSGLVANATVAFVVILPATLFIGATFPLAVRILADDAADSSIATGRTYAWNTAGAIIGSVLAGFFLIPALGFEGSIRLAVGLNLLLAVAALFAVSHSAKYTWLAASIAVVGLAIYRPGIPMGLIDTPIADAGRGGQSIFYAVGRSATVFLKQHQGYFFLRTNGLPEALVEPRGAPPLRHSQKWLTALPIIARPDAESILIVGFGGGVAIEGVPPTVSNIDVIELEPEVLAANAAMAKGRRYNPLTDDRVNIVTNDARNALYLTSKRYDVIVSQPSHPWTAGASHLYTREFIGLAKSRLTADGVYVQWINSLFVDEALLRSLAATLLDQFDQVRMYQPAPEVLLFLASEESIEVEKQLASTGRPISDAVLHYSYIGINSVEDMLVALTADEQGVRDFAAGAAVSSDNHNRMAMFSRSESDGIGGRALYSLLLPHDPLLDVDSWIHTDLAGLKLVHVASRLIAGGFAERAAELSRRTPDDSLALTIEGLGLRYVGMEREAERALAAAVRRDASNDQARYALVWGYLGQIAEGTAPQGVLDLAADLPATAAAVVSGWRHGINREWQALADIDAVLARTRPTDLWFPEAVKLRADWRIQGSEDPEVNLAALRLIDRALMVTPLTDLLVIRAGAAVRLRQAPVFVESARSVRRQIEASLDAAEAGQRTISERDLRTMRARVAGFLGQLQSEFVSPVSDQAQAVRAEFARLNQRLGAR